MEHQFYKQVVNKAQQSWLSLKENKNKLSRAVPRILGLQGQTPHTFTGVSCIQVSDQYSYKK